VLTLRDIMTRDVVTVAPETPLEELAELLSAKHIGGVPVVSGREVVGVVSAADLIGVAAGSVAAPPATPEPDASDIEDAWGRADDARALGEDTVPADFFSGDWDIANENLEQLWKEDPGSARNMLRESSVADVMTREVFSLPPWTPVTAAAAFMRHDSIHRVLVMDGNELQGIVSSMDIVNAVAEKGVGTPPPIVSAHELDFDAGWSHEPLVVDADP
jgi:CBS domain-containing protein